MERGLYIAAAGMISEMVRQDQIANDLANTATPGYKPDKAAQRSFGEVLLENTRTSRLVGRLGRGPFIAEQITDFSQGGINDTGEPLDLAIIGEGFFAVRTPQGVRYTRNGAFRAAADRTLVDQHGWQVLGRDGRPVRINADGTVDPRRVGVFRLAGAEKAGDSFFVGNPQGQSNAEVRTGALESSAVDAGRTMVDMIGSLRAYEASQRAITTIDDTLRLTAQQVGNLPA